MKKKYNLFKNASYALQGVLTLLKEKAFLLEIFFIIPFLIWLYFLNLTIIQKSVMIMSLFTVLIAEALNTAIEYTVDLVTEEWHKFAKKAKDTASAAVFFSIVQAAVVWGINLFFF
ncbi:MAG: diacylglycerol kinase [Nautiliaceae bacterium]